MQYNKEQKRIIALFIKAKLKKLGISQKKISEDYGCSQPAVNSVIWQKNPLGLDKIEDYTAQSLGFSSWESLCQEAIKK